jgi:hypothetical protein
MNEQLRLATHVARTVGLPPTWPNLRTIEIALIFEHADQNRASLDDAAEVIIACAREFLSLSPHHLQRMGLLRYWPLNRFWFEDAIWQTFIPWVESRVEVRSA